MRERKVLEKKAVIFTQAIENKSIDLIQKNLKNYLDENGIEGFTVEIHEIKPLTQYEIHSDCVQLTNMKDGSRVVDTIFFDDVSLVMKRTWGPIRNKVLDICKIFEKNQVRVLNGCDFIEWCHSKIKQYHSFAHKNVMPYSLCFDKSDFDAMKLDPQKEINKLISKVKQDGSLTFPVILKTASGCRSDGVYLVEEKGLEELLKELLSSTNSREFGDGFIIQRYLKEDSKEDSSPNLSTYYRVNCVGGRIDSVVQFQLKWECPKNKSYKKLVDFEGAADRVMIFEKEIHKKAEDLVRELFPEADIIGIDMMISGETIYILEGNDSPAVSDIEARGQKMLDQANQGNLTEAEKNAAFQCINFPKRIAERCGEYFKPFVNYLTQDYDDSIEEQVEMKYPRFFEVRPNPLNIAAIRENNLKDNDIETNKPISFL